MEQISVSIRSLAKRGVECLPRGARDAVSLPKHSVFESPCSLKWTDYQHSIELGAFSYQVSGYCFAARIGRYCSFGENVQIGRQDHPLTWASTSPTFYLHDQAIALEGGFEGADEYHSYRFNTGVAPTAVQITTIGNDVWIGHGAHIRAGVTIGDGAIIAAGSMVVRDVPAYAVVAGNPATLKKMRMPAPQQAGLAKSKWWQYAPWQLAHLNPSNRIEFINGVQAMKDEEPFQPTITDLSAMQL